MILIDVNVLVAAFHQGHPHHTRAVQFLPIAFSSLGPVIIPDVVWSGFVRTVTSKKVLHPAPTYDQIRGFVQALSRHPGYAAAVRALEGPIDTFINLTSQVEAGGNLVPDAYIAAVALESGCPVASFDRDFTRFPGLELVVP